MSKQAHSALRTPGRWYVVPFTRYIANEQGEVLAETHYKGEHNAQANAAYIVRACNSHEALIAALKDAENWLTEFGADGPDTGLHSLIAEMREAISLAGEKTL